MKINILSLFFFFIMLLKYCRHSPQYEATFRLFLDKNTLNITVL